MKFGRNARLVQSRKEGDATLAGHGVISSVGEEERGQFLVDIRCRFGEELPLRVHKIRHSLTRLSLEATEKDPKTEEDVVSFLWGASEYE
jgi:hypothetical protein